MNSDLYFEGKKYISSSRAAKISGYANDYIGQLCRDHKLECRMVGRSWYVSSDSLIQHKNFNGNGTRSRGAKKATIGTPAAPLPALETLSDFLPVLQKKNAPLAVEPLSIAVPKPVVETLRADAAVIPIKKTHFKPTPPPHVFVSETAIALPPRSVKSGLHLPAKMFVATCALIFALAGFRAGLSINPQSQEIYSVAIHQVSKDLQASVISSFSDSIGNFAEVAYNTLSHWLADTQQTFFVMTGKSVAVNTPSIQQNISDQSQSKPTQGMVVVPLNPKTDKDAVVAKIKQSFSDEVSVNPAADGTNGVITPVFKKTKGDEYLYVLVPIKN